MEDIRVFDHFESIYGVSQNFGVLNRPYDSHMHNFLEIAIITSGNATHIVNDKSYNVFAGDVFVIKSRDVHSFSRTDNMGIINISCDDDALSKLGDDVKKLPGYFALFVIEPSLRKVGKSEGRLKLCQKDLTYIISLFELMKKEQSENKPGYKTMFFSLFLQLVTFLCRKYSDFVEIGTSSISLMSKAIGYIENNYKSDIKISELSKMTNMSQNNFCIVFKKNFIFAIVYRRKNKE